MIRVSGERVREIAGRLVRARAPLRPHRVATAEILDASGALLDRGVAIFWPAPKSYTGEDVLELQVHGSPVVVQQVLEATICAGARLAEPGEFTRRAYAHGKIALNEAVAVADLIAAESRAAARAALANFGGALARDVRAYRAALLAELEALSGAIDFPDEVPDPNAADLDAVVARIEAALRALRSEGEKGRLLREGTSVAIVGPPNAGKSSLLNALLGEERALVSEVPGTTRDTIEEGIVVEGAPVRLIDTAGLREHAGRLESAGIERTLQALAQAQIALVTIDGSRPLGAPEREILQKTEGRERIVFCNKADLGDAAGRELASLEPVAGSVFDSGTIASLRAAIARSSWDGEPLNVSRPHLASAYELDAVEEALGALERVRATLAAGDPVDLCAGELQRAVAALGHVSGEAAAEEVVDGIFARFCIGK